MAYEQLSPTDQSALERLPRPTPWLAREALKLSGAILFAAVIPFFLRFGLSDHVQLWDQTQTSLYVAVAVVLSQLWIAKLSRYPGEDPISSVLPGVAMGFGVVLLIILAGQLPYARSLLFLGFLGAAAWYGLVSVLWSRRRKPRLAIVPVGGAASLEQLYNADWLRLSRPANTVGLDKVDGVVADLSADMPREWADFVISCATAGTAVYDLRHTRELMTGRVSLTHAEGIGVNALLPQRGYLTIKSVIDFVAAVAVLPAFLVVIGVTAIAIMAESRGPAFYVQKRVGYRGRQFYCYKLRSMRVGADSVGPSFTAEGDARITRVGRVIRKYRIDELPQIFNILRGEMSWIGPRPEAVALALDYERHIPFYAFRHAVKPGISGWAAIRQGNVAEVEAATVKLEHDFFYIKNISPSLDAFIAAKTVWTMLTGFGSK
jgi:lipopolysaccharide/colanic/teichoic acid biosynthesis glycosyltransferase